MTVRTAFEAVADGDQLNQGFFNTMWRLKLNYTGSGFDSTTSAGASVELTAQAATTSNYLLININALCTAQVVKPAGGGVANGTSHIEIEIKEVGGAYGTIYDKDVFIGYLNDNDALGTRSLGYSSIATVQYIHTLTAGQKTNGYQIQITGSCTGSSGAGDSSITNSQTLLFEGN